MSVISLENNNQPKVRELSEAELDAVAGGEALPGQALSYAAQNIGGQFLGGTLQQIGGVGAVIQVAQAGGFGGAPLTGQDLGQTIAGRTGLI
ncbi:hypothetical protein ACRAWG_35355 [Methylobacterium sp. P31]